MSRKRQRGPRAQITINDDRIARAAFSWESGKTHRLDGTVWWSRQPADYPDHHHRLTPCRPDNPNLGLKVVTRYGTRTWIVSEVPTRRRRRKERPAPPVPDVLKGAPGIPSDPNTKGSR